MKTLPCLSVLAVALSVAAGSRAVASTYLIDFGLSNANGSPTSGPDTNGNHWNNLFSTNPAGNTAGGTGSVATGLAGLVNTDNTASAISLSLASSTQPWSASGNTATSSNFGGLVSPNPALLGSFAIPTATQDYFFIGSGGSAGMTIAGLDPSMTYDFRFYGGRNTASTRTTRYTITDSLGIQSIDLQTSGSGIGTDTVNYPNGNDDQIVSLTGLVPDGSGTLLLDVSNVAGDFSYLGVLEITSVPEPGAILLSALAGLIPLSRRRRS